MTTDSHYIDAEQTNPKGLGRLPAIRRHQLRPAVEIRKPARTIAGSKTLPPKPTVAKPAGRPVLNPVIEHRSPIPAPRYINVTLPKKPPVPTKEQAKPNQKPAAKTSTQNSSVNTNGGYLHGTVNIGGMEIKKTHAAAGGATISGLILWKLLF